MACTQQFRPWTATEEKVFASLLDSNASGAAIAEQLGRTLHSVWSKSKALGLSSARPIGGGVESAFWRENGEKALEMALAGVPMQTIAAELGCTRNAVIGRLNRSRLYQGHPNPPPGPKWKPKPSEGLEERLARYPEPKGCRYIAGEVRRGGIHWCNAPITVFGRSYCDEHHALCWSGREES